MNLICIKHPTYNGSDNPVIACKTCCSLFISRIKQHNDAGGEVAPPRNQGTQVAPSNAGHVQTGLRRVNARFQFDPATI